MNEVATLLKQWCVGVTGGIATGKSTVANDLRRRGYIVIDADQLARRVVEFDAPGYWKVVEHFGTAILVEGGAAIDRRKLRTVVFDDEKERRWLEETLHPLIEERFAVDLYCLELVKTPRLFFYENALLYERGSQGSFLETWCTVCDRPTQIARIMRRDDCDWNGAEKILGVQMDAVEKASKATRTLDTHTEAPILLDMIDEHLKNLRIQLAINIP